MKFSISYYLIHTIRYLPLIQLVILIILGLWLIKCYTFNYTNYMHYIYLYNKLVLRQPLYVQEKADPNTSF